MDGDTPIDVVWDGERRYRGGRADGPSIDIDADRRVAPGPVDAVAIALVACAGVDIVEILRKRRTPVVALRARVHVTRRAGPPRRIAALRLMFDVVTTAERTHVERAIALAIERYCSVSASLAPDITMRWELQLEEPRP
jgi:putative redox protein